MVKAGMTAENPNLVPCSCCFKDVSREADACPHCGLSFVQRHGVFYYVCAVLGSLLLLGLIVFGAAIFAASVHKERAIAAAAREVEKTAAKPLVDSQAVAVEAAKLAEVN